MFGKGKHELVVFCFTNSSVKIGAFPNLEGKQIFPKSPKENKNSSNVSAACLFKRIDAQDCLEKPFISVYTII